MATTGKQILDRVHNIKGNSEKEIVSNKNRVMVACGITGGMFGLYYGYSKNKNILVMTALGAIGGAFAGRMLMPK